MSKIKAILEDLSRAGINTEVVNYKESEQLPEALPFQKPDYLGVLSHSDQSPKDSKDTEGSISPIPPVDPSTTVKSPRFIAARIVDPVNQEVIKKEGNNR